MTSCAPRWTCRFGASVTRVRSNGPRRRFSSSNVNTAGVHHIGIVMGSHRGRYRGGGAQKGPVLPMAVSVAKTAPK
jgi:hypothetical protein